MSKTLRSTVSFSLSQAFDEEALQVLRESRAEARVLVQAGLPEHIKGDSRAMCEMFASDLTEEQLLERVIRAGIRQYIREDFVKELTGDGQRVRVGSVKVAFEERERG